jgi:hypothetical protein
MGDPTALSNQGRLVPVAGAALARRAGPEHGGDERVPPQVLITSGPVHECGGTGLAHRRGERAGIRWWPGGLGGLFCDKFLTHLK